MTKLNLGAGAHPLEGFVNRGPENDGWRFEDGLEEYRDESVDGISIGHALMFLPIEKWASAFVEFERVLKPGGVIRITEDATNDPRSSRYGGFPGAVTLTTADLVKTYLEVVGLRAVDVAWNYSHFTDDSLMQNNHGGYPKCFFCEGIKAGRNEVAIPHADPVVIVNDEPFDS